MPKARASVLYHGVGNAVISEFQTSGILTVLNYILLHKKWYIALNPTSRHRNVENGETL